MKYSIDYYTQIAGKFNNRKDAIADVQNYAQTLRRNGAQVANLKRGSFTYRVSLADGNMSEPRKVEIIKW